VERLDNQDMKVQAKDQNSLMSASFDQLYPVNQKSQKGPKKSNLKVTSNVESSVASSSRR